MDNKTDNQPGDRQGKKRQGQIRVSLHIYKKLQKKYLEKLYMNYGINYQMLKDKKLLLK